MCGASGGLIVIWDNNRLEVEDQHVGSFPITLVYKVKGSTDRWLFTSLWANTIKGKFSFWEELDNIGRAWVLPWLIAGVFNAIKKKVKRTSSKVSRENFLYLTKYIKSPPL